MIGTTAQRVSFGAASAIVTSVGLITGFGAAGMSRTTLLAGLLILGLADNLTDSLSIHIYQEAENLEQHAAFRATVGNFTTRLLISLSFVAVLVFAREMALAVSLAWGVVLLVALTWFVARTRKARVLPEVLRHLAVAAVVIAMSRAVGGIVGMYIK